MCNAPVKKHTIYNTEHLTLEMCDRKGVFFSSLYITENVEIKTNALHRLENSNGVSISFVDIYNMKIMLEYNLKKIVFLMPGWSSLYFLHSLLF